jgi:hypothetical protein
MDLYAFTVERFIITDTRSKHLDTLALGYSANVDGVMVRNRAFRLRVAALGADQPDGFNNGTYDLIDHLPPNITSPGLDRMVVNDPTEKVVFSFQLLNAGNVPDAMLAGRVAATAEAMATTSLGFAASHLSLSRAAIRGRV